MEINEVLTLSYTGAPQTITLNPGIYKFECWGAKGGTYGRTPGLGGYVVGELQLLENTEIHAYVGGKGSVSAGGWNGGGNGQGAAGGGGGGASDIRIGGTELDNRIIVGAGGGGAGYSGEGGNGGGLTGFNGTSGTGASQSAGGNIGGTFGLGANATVLYCGGGGGGWYGGGTSEWSSEGAGGGSSYYGDLTNASTTSGVRSDNGEIKITLLSAPSFVKKRRFTQII